MRAEDTSGHPPIRSLMADRLGRLGIRSAQLLVVIALVSVVVLALVQMKLVIIPVLIVLAVHNQWSKLAAATGSGTSSSDPSRARSLNGSGAKVW